jgi:hypothetical protein
MAGGPRIFVEARGSQAVEGVSRDFFNVLLGGGA